ncbi:hypothetical protein HK18_08575 [Commensalibacter intestini]|uniref:Uncharacterized protein n=2 Tax=Commensalibacter intestini TaxID=479936 RepID=A0A251ZV61_9PROT|nr:hypothetical protein [Commensalibacter intestini]OUI78548.1 hypothetical protein HK18_08575 [Commensalibacter intestini]
MIFIIIGPPTSTTNGIPNCDTPFTQELTLRTFNRIPLMHNLGFSSVNLKNIQKVSSSSTKKRYKATTMLTNDTDSISIN